MGLSRRDLIGIIGGGAAGVGLSRFPLRRFVGLDDLELARSTPGVERWETTCCQVCPGGCGMEVRIVDGRPVGVRGSRLHPVSRGGLCPAGAEAVHLLYHPHRYKGPLVRASVERPSDDWKGVDWEDALAAITGRITNLREAGQADRIVVLDGYGRGLLSGLARVFLEEIGSSGYFVDRGPDPMRNAMRLSQGHSGKPAYDLENSKTILSFGAPLLEGWDCPVRGNRVVGILRRDNASTSSRALIQIDVRSSRTTDKADKFVRIIPGAQGAAALAIAYVLITQELYDRDYVENHTSGFEDWKDEDGVEHEGFRTFVLRACRPQDMERQTGIASREIFEIARRFGEQRPSVAVTDGSQIAYSNGIRTAHAIQSLNALVGAIERPGGTLLGDPVPGPLDNRTPADSAHAESLPGDTEALLRRAAEGGEKPGLLILLHADPFFSTPHSSRVREIIGDDTLVVDFTPLKDESSGFADYILPDHTFLERWQDAAAPASFPNAVFGLTRPITAPLYDTRNSGDVLLDLLHRAVPDSTERAPWTSFEGLIAANAKMLFEMRRGSVFTNQREADEIREMELRGWWIPSHDGFEEFWSELQATGGWWDPAYPHGLWGRTFLTEDRRFNFFAKVGLHESSDEPAGLPVYVPAMGNGSTGEDTLVLHLFRPMVPNSGVASNLPWVREVVNSSVAWETWAELHHEDAERLGIHAGDMVEVSAQGKSFAARAQISMTGQPGVVAVPYGLSRESGGPWARAACSRPNSILSPTLLDEARSVARQGTRVSVHKTSGGGSHA